MAAGPQNPKKPIIRHDSRRHSLTVVLVLFMLLGSGVAYLRVFKASEQRSLRDLRTQLHELSNEVERLKQEQEISTLLLNRYRGSIGYIHGIYHVGVGNQRPEMRAGISGTGFLIGDGLVVTNRHVAEPWYGDAQAKRLTDRGATSTLESLTIYLPSSAKPVKLLPVCISKTSDLAVLRIEEPDVLRDRAALPIAHAPGSPGQFVAVIGYPLGIQAMVAKSPSDVYERLAYRHDDMHAANELAAMSLIRPSTTYGHLGDVVGDKIIYDAPSAHGGSGAPVLNSRGEVIGVNSAYMDGFSGATIGVSVESLVRLLAEVQAHQKSEGPVR